ncbi:hypothetical protein CIB48_g3115 [Xylaria polymorpha]|nr:hypothetical protein CIB48_g3115 [Xylaria polymorpha]
MQILSAPSRQEINRVHTWLRSLDIGIPSIKNLCSVFETTYDGSQWYLTLATEAFTQGAPFFPPGASLSPAGIPNRKRLINGPFDNGGYGEPIFLDQYWNASSVVRQKIASVAEESHSWTFLNPEQCHSEYISCNSRNKYGDVVFILDSTASKGGWPRSDVFTFDPSTDLSARWDPHIPPNAVNSLWFSTQCHTTRYKSLSGKEDDCSNTCLGAMGVNEHFFHLGERLPMAHEPWLITFFPAVRQHNKSLFGEGLEFNNEFDFLRVDHCLAHPMQPNCKVGLSNALLLIVILSILIKIIQGSVIIWKLPSESLVTPGDAIESFILYPDPVTKGLGPLDIVDSQRIEFGMRRHWLDTLDSRCTTQVRPRRWKKSLRRFGNIIPNSAWVKSYSILVAGVALLTIGFAVTSIETENNYITLHWLVSNAVFLYVNEGGYWDSSGLPGFSDAFSVSDGSLIEIAFSPLFFLVLFIASLLFIIFPPLLLGLFRMKGDMVAGGWNSLVISAACHVPDTVNEQDEQALSNENDSYSRDCSRTDDAEAPIASEEGEESFNKLLELTRRKLRWGAMELTRRPEESISSEGEVLFHLGFGGEEHHISEPKDGQHYI